jgi:hypothetical protein
MVARHHSRELGAGVWLEGLDVVSYVFVSFAVSCVAWGPLTDHKTSETVPIGTTKGQGLEYPRNPRFNADGVWLPRKQWPPELR